MFSVKMAKIWRQTEIMMRGINDGIYVSIICVISLVLKTPPKSSFIQINIHFIAHKILKWRKIQIPRPYKIIIEIF